MEEPGTWLHLRKMVMTTPFPSLQLPLPVLAAPGLSSTSPVHVAGRAPRWAANLGISGFGLLRIGHQTWFVSFLNIARPWGDAGEVFRSPEDVQFLASSVMVRVIWDVNEQPWGFLNMGAGSLGMTKHSANLGI